MPDDRRRFGVTRENADRSRLWPRAVALAVALCLVALGPALDPVIADQPAPTPAPPSAPAANPPPVKPAAEPKPLFQLFPADPLDVTTIGGVGAIPFRLRIVDEKAPPLTSLTVTAPVGGGRALPDGAARVTSERIETVGTEHFHVLTMAVNAPGAIAVGTTYKGQILVPGGPHLPFTVTERGGSDLEILTDKIALVLGFSQQPTVRVPVRNKGTTPAAISSITTSLTDTPSGRLEQTTASPGTLPAPIPAGTVAEIEVSLPWPTAAGVYAGPLAFTAGAQRVTVPFSVTTRGPYSWFLLPAALFFLVVAAGAFLSYKLEGWFGEGGGLLRAEAVVALARAERTLTVLAETLRARVAAQPALTALSSLATQLDVGATAAADARLERPTGLPFAEALPVARAAQAAGRLLTSLLDTELPGLAGQPAAMTALNTSLAAVSVPSDQPGLTTFDAAVRKAFADAKPKRGLAPASASVAATAAPVDAVEAIDSTGKAIARMALLQRTVIILVAILTAYQTFYAANAAFGRFGDYVAVFVWSLGMTQAGTQVLARARAKTTS